MVPILSIEQVFETERTEMIDKTCTPANRETVVLVFLSIVKRIMTTSHVNLRDDVFQETQMCGATVNVNIIELTRMFTVKKNGGALDRS